MPRTTTLKLLVGEHAIKPDYARLALLPEAEGDPFYTFDCVLLTKGEYKSDVKFTYKASSDVVRVPVFTKVVYNDDREGLVVYCQDTDLVVGGTKAGKFMAVVSLPLKTRQYKTESEVFYLGESELGTVKALSDRPALDTPDLEGFVKSFAPYKKLGVKSLDDLQ